MSDDRNRPLPSHWRAAAVLPALAAALAGTLLFPGCKGAEGPAADAGAEVGEVGLPECPPPETASSEAAADDFGPAAKALQAASALARINVYEITAPFQLQRIDVFMRSETPGTRMTIAVYQTPSRTAPFVKVQDVQVDVPSCEGWASSGLLTLPLQVGRFYAIGFDPNQAITPFLDSTAGSIPVDGRFGRLIGSKTATSVSVDTLGWDKLSDKEFTRQRLLTAPRPADDADVPPDAASDGGAPSDAAADLRG